MKIQPLDDKIVLKPLSAETVTKSGIVLPDTVDKEKPEQGEVIAVGPGKLLDDGKRADMPVKKGDKVLFTKYAPNEIKIDGEEHLVVSASDLLAVVS